MYFGALNSLAQLVLKLTCPGVPDLYRGTELWDLSLVDPDNRRPVNYDVRQQLLSDLRVRELSGDLPQLCAGLLRTGKMVASRCGRRCESCDFGGTTENYFSMVAMSR